MWDAAGGGVLAGFIARGHKVVGVDASDSALALCRKKGYEVIKSDLEKDEFPPLEDTPDYITALDVLEHMTNPVGVLRKLAGASGNKTRLIATVPAYGFLYGDWDRMLGHVKRYTKTVLAEELKMAGWEITRLTYIHLVPLLPAILQRRLLGPIKKRLFTSVTGEAFYDPPPVMNRLLCALYAPELKLFGARKSLPFGLSILAVSRLAASNQSFSPADVSGTGP